MKTERMTFKKFFPYLLLVALVAIFATMVTTRAYAKEAEDRLGGGKKETKVASLGEVPVNTAAAVAGHAAGCEVVHAKGWTMLAHCDKNMADENIRNFGRSSCFGAPEGNCNIWIWTSAKDTPRAIPMEDKLVEKVARIWVNRKDYLKVCGKDYC